MKKSFLHFKFFVETPDTHALPLKFEKKSSEIFDLKGLFVR